MKHALAQVVQVIPYPTSDPPIIDREGYFTAVLAVSVEAITGDPTSAKLAVSLQHCDTESGTFVEVNDPVKIIGHTPGAVEAGKLYNVDMDLLACKRYIKAYATVMFEGGTDPAATTASALALGDKTSQPV